MTGQTMLVSDKLLGKLRASEPTPVLLCRGVTQEVLSELTKVLSVFLPDSPNLDFVYYGPDGQIPDPDSCGRVWILDNGRGVLTIRRFINGKWMDSFPLGYTRWVEGADTTFSEAGWAVADGRAKTVPDLSHLFKKNGSGVYTTFIVAFEGYSILD